ncbi:zinc ribbon domain-containing protein [Angustibacter aerolatus]
MQAVDTRLDQIAHRRRTMPEHAELAALETRSTQLRDQVVAAQTHSGDVRREVAKAETDVELVRTRLTRDRTRLESGQGGHKELESLQHEVATLERRQSALEDVELEAMERLEAAQAEAERVTAEQSELLREVDVVTARRDAADAQLAAERVQLEASRDPLVTGLDAALLALYEKIRADSGTGAALLRGRRCEGCRLELNPQELGQIRGTAADEVVRHEDCGRILVRTAESGL